MLLLICVWVGIDRKEKLDNRKKIRRDSQAEGSLCEKSREFGTYIEAANRCAYAELCS